MLENVTPSAMKKWLIFAAIVYFLVPFDLVSDFLGVFGRIDDVTVMALLAWFFRNHVKQYAAQASRAGQAGSGRGGRAGPELRGTGDRVQGLQPHEILGVAPQASRDAVRAAYKARMQEYHPDKVAHLGEELQQLAHAKSLEIQKAYRDLSDSSKER